MLSQAYASWLNSVASCCPQLADCLDDERPLRSPEKRMLVLYDQPGLVPPPSAEALRPASKSGREKTFRKGLGSLNKGSFSVRRRFGSNASSSRRPQISAPSNFRHIYSESFQFPQQLQQPRQRPRSFRPLQLSIYQPDNSLSPLLPHFEYVHPDVTPPPPAYTNNSFDDDSATLTHNRSYSSMSFHIPRRPLNEASSFVSNVEDSPPRIPPRARTRAYTSPSVEAIVERIASAMIERDRLQEEIESVIERQSIYVSSRPSTAYGMPESEPMPSIPALPPSAPSFAERLSTERPHTAPSRSMVNIPHRAKSFEEAAAVFTTPLRHVTPIDDRSLDRPLAPPLPLVLRPPLRKKKSFSRVSNWLFPTTEHQRDISLDSITNIPQPVTSGGGFYQVMSEGRTSVDTLTTVSTWESEEEDRTMPTTWSPGSSPVTKLETPSSLARTATFGAGGNGPRPTSVGVAF